jgi:iron complex transport system substrate-binding protein
MRRALIKPLLLLGVALAASSSLAQDAGEEAEREGSQNGVVSAGICADQLILPLVERHRLRGVSLQATDPSVSLLAEQARGLPLIAPSAEALILSGANTVVLNTYGDGKTEELLKRLGVNVVRVPYDPDLASIPSSLRRLGQSLGASERANQMATDFEQRLDRLRTSHLHSPVLAAYYRPDGGSAGQGTYVSEAMEAAGYRSLATALEKPGWARLDLESLVLHPPQSFIASFFGRSAFSVSRNFSRHPVFEQMFSSLPVVSIPGRLWGCGGWPVIFAAEDMAAQNPFPSIPANTEESP